MKYKGYGVSYKNVGNNKYKLTVIIGQFKYSVIGHIENATKAIQSYIDDCEPI